MLFQLFSYIFLAFCVCLGVAQRSPRRTYEIAVDIGDGIGCESSAPRLTVEFPDRYGNLVTACEMRGYFSRGRTYYCQFTTRRTFNSMTLSTNSADAIGIREVRVRDLAQARRVIFKYNNFERVGSNSRLDHVWFWVGANDIENTFMWTDQNTYRPGRRVYKNYRVQVQVGTCGNCASGANEIQVWFVNRNGVADDRPSCMLYGSFGRGATRECTFGDTRQIGGIILGSANTDGLGLQSVRVRDMTYREELFEYDRMCYAGWGSFNDKCDTWVDGLQVPKQEFRFNLN